MARKAAGVVPISDTFIPQLDAWGVARNGIEVVPNWGAIDEMPLRPRDNDWAEEHGLVGVPVVMYAGTLGLKHDPSVLVRLAEGAPRDTRVVVVSQGQGREWLESEAGETSGLLLLDYQPYERLPDVLASADVLVVVLESDASRYSVPSKVLNYLCAGRPVLGLMPLDNAVAHMIESARGRACGGSAEHCGRRLAALNAFAGRCRRRVRRWGPPLARYAETTFDVRRMGDTL